jgi:hypothetical protein
MSQEVGRLQIRLLTRHQVLWVLAGHEPTVHSDVVPISGVPIQTAHDTQMVSAACRYRPPIERTHRFDWEERLETEEIRVRTSQWIRRLFALVLLVALFVHHVAPA